MPDHQFDHDRSRELYDEGHGKMVAGDHSTAIDCLEESVRINPHYESLELLWECYLRLGRFTEAIPALAASTTLHSQARAPFLLGKAFLALGEKRKAEAMARVAIERNADYKEAKDLLNSLAESGASD